MNNNAVFIDANVLLETVLKGRRHAEKAQKYISSRSVVISPLTAHLFVYFGQKDGLENNLLLAMLTNHRFTDFGTPQVMWAIRNYQDNDFEDALQVACAVLEGCQTFVTFDRKLAQRYQKFINIHLL